MSLSTQNARLFDTVSGSEFGPQCADEKEVADLAHHVWRVHGIDARAASNELLDRALDELRSGIALSLATHSSMACQCGSGKPWASKLEQIGKATVTSCEVCAANQERLG